MLVRAAGDLCLLLPAASLLTRHQYREMFLSVKISERTTKDAVYVRGKQRKLLDAGSRSHRLPASCDQETVRVIVKTKRQTCIIRSFGQNDSSGDHLILSSVYPHLALVSSSTVVMADVTGRRPRRPQ